MALYTDLSHHDWNRVKGEFDWSAIKKATSSVVCLRASYGDPSRFSPPTYHFVDMAKEARSAGFDTIGGYHNLIAGDQASINRQVDYLRREMAKVEAEFAMLDVERYEELLDNGLWPRMDDVQQFCDRWRAVDDRVLLVYLPKWVWEASMRGADLRPLRCPLVASDYGTNPNGTPTGVYATQGGDAGRGWASYGNVDTTIWQFGSNVDCPGASGQTDVNAFRGTESQLRTLLTGSGEGFLMGLSDEEQEGMRSQLHVLAVEWRHFINGWTTVAAKNHPSGYEVTLQPLVKMNEALVLCRAIAEKVDLDPEELEAIEKAAREGALSLADAIVAGIVDKLPAETMTREEAISAATEGVREAFSYGLAAPSGSQPASNAE